MSIKVFSMAILASLLFVSCSQTSIDYDSKTTTTTSANELKTYEVEIEAQTNEPETRAAMPFKVTEENINGKTVLYPKLNITEETMPSVVVLYNKNNGVKEVVEANWNVIKEDTSIKFNLNKLTSKSDLANGEWYMMSLMGGEKNGNDLKVDIPTDINQIEKDQTFTSPCPFATTWRRIVKNGNKLKLSNKSKKMVFKPQGVFLVMSLESRMTLPTKISRELTLESNAFCTSGSYKFNVSNNVGEDADLAANYWEPNSQLAISDMSAVYKKYNAQHYRSTIKLNYNSGKDDGTLRNGQSDLDKYIYFNSYKKSTGTNTPNTRTNRGFLLCLMPVDYTKTSNYPGGIVNETLLFGDVEVTDENRTNYTYDKNTYTKNPSTWRPYMGHRYLLGSFSNPLSKGSSYDMTLRIIRPNLPIERLWAYKQGKELQNKTRKDADKIAKGETVDNNYPLLSSKLYRLPKYTEFTPVFNNPKSQLQTNKELGGLRRFKIGDGYGFSLTVDSHRNFVDLNGKQRKFSNWYCAVQDSKVMYAIMYMKPVKDIDPNPTNNYKVAVRMTFPEPDAKSGVAKVETYYLGPNYNLSFNVAGYYLCHEEFWKKLDRQDIISREFQLGYYWLTTDNIIDPEHEPKATYTEFKLDGSAQPEYTKTNGTSYFLPWLNSPAW
ncbi:hypothetical protein [Prevotella ihumii]|uniref:hypothetical protein n=1 Tax=Prevotella ihumii TaxID=1917878 RepID=UPI001F30B501|nr:hypothetical protein [Prevotella ihumii]